MTTDAIVCCPHLVIVCPPVISCHHFLLYSFLLPSNAPYLLLSQSSSLGPSITMSCSSDPYLAGRVLPSVGLPSGSLHKVLLCPPVLLHYIIIPVGLSYKSVPFFYYFRLLLGCSSLIEFSEDILISHRWIFSFREELCSLCAICAFSSPTRNSIAQVIEGESAPDGVSITLHYFYPKSNAGRQSSCQLLHSSGQLPTLCIVYKYCFAIFYLLLLALLSLEPRGLP